MATNLPLAPVLPGDSLDASWVMVIARGLVEHRQFGVELVFTYGPLGALYAVSAWPELLSWSLVYWIVILVAFALAVRSTLSQRPLWQQLVAVAPLLLSDGHETCASALVLYAALGARQLGQRWVHAAVVSGALALLGLGKFSFALIGLPGLVVLSVECWHANNGARRHAAWLGYVVVFSLGWFSAGQALSTLPSWVLTSLDLSLGYGQAMGVMGPAKELYWALAMLAVLGAVAGAQVIETVREDRRDALATLVAIGVCWLVFKAAFVRQDAHVGLFVWFSAAALLSLIARPRPAPAGRARVLLHGVGLACWVGLTWVSTILRTEPQRTPFAIVAELLQQRFASLVTLPQLWANSSAATVAALSRIESLPAVTGSVDVASIGQGMAVARQGTWSPRPVFQSYAAFTPLTAELNAAHLEGPKGADHYFVRLFSVDQRFSLQQDPLLWPLLLSHYAWKPGGPPLRFDRLPKPNAIESAPLGLSRDGSGWTFAEQRDWDYVLLEVSAGRSFGEALKNFVFKPREVLIELTLDSGATHTRRFISSLSGVPFIASPLVDTDDDLTQLALGLSGARVKSFRFRDRDGRLIPTDEEPRAVGVRVKGGTQIPLTAQLRVEQGIDDVRQHPLLFVRGELRRNAHAPAVLSLEVEAPVLQICFGVRGDQPWEHADFDGVRFVVRKPEGETPLIDRLIAPTADSVAHDDCAEVALRPGRQKLLFETRDNGTKSWDWAWWSVTESQR
jgi:hypothetical protein